MAQERVQWRALVLALLILRDSNIRELDNYKINKKFQLVGWLVGWLVQEEYGDTYI